MPVLSPRALLAALAIPSLLGGCLDWSSEKRKLESAADASTLREDAATDDPGDTSTADDPDAGLGPDAAHTDVDASADDQPDAEPADAAQEPDADGPPDPAALPCPMQGCPSPYVCSGNAATYTCPGQYADFPLPVRRTGDALEAQKYRVDDLVIHDDVTGLMWPREVLNVSATHAEATAACAALELASHDDWRLASLHELMTLLGPERALSVDSTVFLGWNGGDDYLTSTRNSEALNQTWCLRMYGVVWAFPAPVETSFEFMCVRTERVSYSGAASERFRAEAGGALVHDTRTQLHWEASVNIALTRLPYADAVARCAGLGTGRRSFRLPSLAELISVIDYARPSESRLPELFTQQRDLWTWSRSLGPAEAEPPWTSVANTMGWAEAADLPEGRHAVRCVSPD